MTARQCPNCNGMVPGKRIAVYSYDLICPHCQHPLEISESSRNISVFIGLTAGVVAWWIASWKYTGEPGALGWVLPIFFSYLAASAVAPLVLMLEAKLQLKTVVPVLIHESSTPHPSH
jgi:hypothetical protein